MSYRVASLVTLGYTGPPGAFRVLAVLAEFADDTGYTYPGVEAIARIARCSQRRVSSHLSALESGGWIRCATSRKGGRGKQAYWRINVGMLKANAQPKRRTAAGNPDGTVTLSDAETLTDSVRNPDGSVRKTLTEPSPEAVREAIRKRSERERAQPRHDGAHPRGVALSLVDAIGQDPELPTRCRTEGATLRPDLTPEQVAASLDRWVHDRTAKAFRRVDWLADFKGWIGRERSEAAPPTPSAAIVNGKPYRPPAGWDRDDAMTDKVGRDLGIRPGSHEQYPEYRGRLRKALRANGSNA